MNFFDRVVTENGDIDPGYLQMLFVGLLVLGAIPAAVVICVLRVILSADHSSDLVGLAAVIGAAGVAYGGSAAGAAVFRRSGQPAPAPPPAAPLPAVRVDVGPTGGQLMSSGQQLSQPDLEAAARGVEPCPKSAKLGKRGR